MSNWDWVNELYERLVDNGDQAVADALYRLPEQAVARMFDAVETTAPVLLDYAKSHKLPWLEVYARHWRLQAYVARNCTNLEETLREAVALVAMTAREDVRDCPQSRCAVQDLSLSFGGVDGPGYAQERLRAIQETVARLEPGADCSACMMGEAVACLNSMGRYSEAYEYGIAWLDRAREEGGIGASFWTEQATDLFEAALGAGQFAEARKIIDRSRPDRAEMRDQKALSIARLELACGNASAAAKSFPSVTKACSTEWFRRPWLATAVDLVAADALANDAALGAAATAVVRRCEANGQLRDMFDSAVDAGTLAVWRGRWGVAKLRADDADRMRPKLRGDHGADAKLAALREKLQALTPGCTGVAADKERELDQALVDRNTEELTRALRDLGETPEDGARLLSSFSARPIP